MLWQSQIFKSKRNVTDEAILGLRLRAIEYPP